MSNNCLILYGEILSWSLVGVKGLRYTSVTAENGGLEETIWERDEGLELLRGCSL